MSVNLSFIGGAGWQFFDDNGDPLSGGKIYTYAAGTTTPLTTYTSRDGLTANANPIILDAAGRTPQQIWSTEDLLYKYVVAKSNDVQIRVWDNIGGAGADLANTADNSKGDALIGFRQSNTAGFLTDATAKTVNDKLQEIVSVKDFGAVGDGIADDTNAINNFFAYLAANNVGSAECVGRFRVTNKIQFIGTSTSTRSIYFSAYFVSDYTSESEMFLIKGVGRFQATGIIILEGKGGTTFNNRTNGRGIVIEDCAFSSFDRIEAFYFKYDGVRSIGTTTQTRFSYIRAWYCGGGAGTGATTPSLAFSAVTNTDTSGSTSQRSILTVTPGSVGNLIAGQTLLRIGSSLHYVDSFNNTLGTVTIYPWVENGITSGTATTYLGAGYFGVGADNSANYISKLDTLVCGIGCYNLALYPVSIGSHVTQVCGVGHIIGIASNAAVSGSVLYSYYEANDFDIVQGTPYNVNYSFLSTAALLLNKSLNFAPRLTSGEFNPSFTAFLGVSIDVDGTRHERRPSALSFIAPSTLSTSLIPSTTPIFTQRANSGVILLKSNSDNQRLFAINDFILVIRGTGANARPTGAFTLTPDAGYSINGGSLGATATISDFIGPVIIHAWLEGTNWEVTITSTGEQILNGSATYDPISLVNGSGVTTTVSVTGAALGDFVEASFSNDLQGIILTGYVSTANTVSVRFQNETGGTLDLASGTLRVRVRKA